MTVTKVIDLIPGIVRDIPSIGVKDLRSNMFWEDFVCKHQPLLIKGAVLDWPAVKKWPQEGYLESISGSVEVSLTRMFNPNPSALLSRIKSRISLVDCLKEMRRAPLDATLSIPSTTVPAGWANDLGNYSFLTREYEKKPRSYSRRRLFIYKNASTEWHAHHTDETLTTQLLGSKRVSIFRLSRENWRHYYQILKFNVHHAEWGKNLFPKNPNLTKFEGTLESGDALYLPPFWWHGIDPADSEIGVTLAHCFRTPWIRLGDRREPFIAQYSRTLPPRLRARFAARNLISSLVRKFKGEKW